MALNWPDKDPNETLDYKLNWRSHIPAGDKITASVWSSPAGITKTNTTFTDYTTTLWLAGGVADQTYSFTNTITTEDGRVLECTVSITVVEK